MAYGPLEYYIIGFEGSKLSPHVVLALKRAADSGSIHIIDLVFVSKDAHGSIRGIEYQDFDPEIAQAFAGIDQDAEGLFTPEDFEEIGKDIAANSSAVLVLVEHRWAADIRQAVTSANGRLIDHGILTEEAAHTLESATA